MHLVIRMNMDNAAFDDVEGNGRSSEAARILRELADRIDGHPHFSPGHDQSLLDVNGNEIGYMQVKDGDYQVLALGTGTLESAVKDALQWIDKQAPRIDERERVKKHLQDALASYNASH